MTKAEIPVKPVPKNTSSPTMDNPLENNNILNSNNTNVPPTDLDRDTTNNNNNGNTNNDIEHILPLPLQDDISSDAATPLTSTWKDEDIYNNDGNLIPSPPPLPLANNDNMVIPISALKSNDIILSLDQQKKVLEVLRHFDGN